MHGNVWEWCRDGPRHYTPASTVDPEGALGMRRAVRGGSWIRDALYARSAYRYWFHGNHPTAPMDAAPAVVC